MTTHCERLDQGLFLNEDRHEFCKFDKELLFILWLFRFVGVNGFVPDVKRGFAEGRLKIKGLVLVQIYNL